MKILKYSTLIFQFCLLCVLWDESWEIGGPRCAPSTLNGTTPDFEQIILGRCYYFVNVLHKKDCSVRDAKINCTELMNEFNRAILGKEPCEVEISDFDRFLELANHSIGANSTLFWSGAYTTAHDLTRVSSYWTLEDTLSGYLLNELVFCSQNATYSYADMCPDTCVTRNNPYWNAASRDFAQKARGYVLLVLNGTRTTGAIYNTSTFFRYELPALTSENVQQVKVLLVHNPDMAKYETCQQPKTLQLLESSLREKNIEYACEDNPDEIVFILCTHSPMSKECQSVKNFIESGGVRLKANIYLVSLVLAYFFI